MKNRKNIFRIFLLFVKRFKSSQVFMALASQAGKIQLSLPKRCVNDSVKLTHSFNRDTIAANSIFSSTFIRKGGEQYG